MNPILSCDTLSCRRENWNDSGLSRVESITAEFQAGRFYGVCGEQGSGKGLLLNVLGLLEPPDSGSLLVDGDSALHMPQEDAMQLRNEAFGFVFDHSCLLPSFSLAENVAMPLFRICGGDAREARQRTLAALEFCGIENHEATLAGRLSADHRMRAALARALVHEPSILIAISPQGGDSILELGRRVAHELGLCVLWAGMESDLSRHADQLITMKAGRIAAAPSAS